MFVLSINYLPLINISPNIYVHFESHEFILILYREIFTYYMNCIFFLILFIFLNSQLTSSTLKFSLSDLCSNFFHFFQPAVNFLIWYSLPFLTTWWQHIQLTGAVDEVRLVNCCSSTQALKNYLTISKGLTYEAAHQPLVAGCSIAHKYMLVDRTWAKLKPSKWMVSVILTLNVLICSTDLVFFYYFMLL